MSPLQLPLHQPGLPSTGSLLTPQSVHQSICHEPHPIHHFQSTPTITYHWGPILSSTDHCLTKPTDVEPSHCHDPSIIDHQSANPSRCPAAPNTSHKPQTISETDTSHSPPAPPPAPPRHTHRRQLRLDKPSFTHQRPAVWQTTTIHTKTATMNPHQKNKVDVSVRTDRPS